jgi:hypothetical protein
LEKACEKKDSSGSDVDEFKKFVEWMMEDSLDDTDKSSFDDIMNEIRPVFPKEI